MANVINAGRDAVDAGGTQDESASLADGEVVWSWRLDAGVKSIEATLSATETNQPDLR